MEVGDYDTVVEGALERGNCGLGYGRDIADLAGFGFRRITVLPLFCSCREALRSSHCLVFFASASLCSSPASGLSRITSSCLSPYVPSSKSLS